MSVRNGVLALLDEGPKHGYELKKELEDRTGSLWELNVGQVYTTLSRLVRDGLVVELDARGEHHEGRDHLRYALTDDGRIEVGRWFATTRDREGFDRDELVFKLTLGLEVRGVDLDGVIDAQRAHTTGALQALTREKAAAAESDLARLFALDAAIARVEAELNWLERCQARLAATRRPVGPETSTRRSRR